jgi:hypothetical protein
MPTPEETKPWFPAKKYGWGWGPPTCWQGWVVIAVWLVMLVGGSLLISPGRHFAGSVAGYVAYAFGLAAGLVAVCWSKGEKPRWRWGKD